MGTPIVWPRHFGAEGDTFHVSHQQVLVPLLAEAPNPGLAELSEALRLVHQAALHLAGRFDSIPGKSKRDHEESMTIMNIHDYVTHGVTRWQ